MLPDRVGDCAFPNPHMVDPRVGVVAAVHSIVRDAVIALFTKVAGPPMGVFPEAELSVLEELVDLDFPVLDDDRSDAVVGAVEFDVDGERAIDAHLSPVVSKV